MLDTAGFAAFINHSSITSKYLSIIRPNTAQGYVYIAISEATGHVKIGWTEDPKSRRRTLNHRTSSSRHDRITILHAHPVVSRDAERAMHRRFAADRERGEWFRASPELLAIGAGERVPELGDPPIMYGPEPKFEPLLPGYDKGGPRPYSLFEAERRGDLFAVIVDAAERAGSRAFAIEVARHASEELSAARDAEARSLMVRSPAITNDQRARTLYKAWGLLAKSDIRSMRAAFKAIREA